MSNANHKLTLREIKSVLSGSFQYTERRGFFYRQAIMQLDDFLSILDATRSLLHLVETRGLCKVKKRRIKPEGVK